MCSAASDPPLTVTQLNQRARQMLERSFSRVMVVGEVSNLKVSSGHRYFSLKDDRATLPAVLFRREASSIAFDFRNGIEVVATGRLTIYPAYGKYQIVVERVEPRGAGALQTAFEELKKKLAAEGLFAEQKKRALPVLPGRVAVVTSPTGAVIRDILNVSTRRMPNAQILVVPTRVQGAGSAEEIANAIGRVSELADSHKLEVMVVARGGGSLEDLWGFNDERVARAIASSPIPVVSAVGHETDFTIADFVADKRAPTPSAAAELIFPVRSELMASLERRIERSARSIRRDIQHQRARLRAAHAGVGDGRSMLAIQTQRLEYLRTAMARGMERSLAGERRRLGGFETRLAGLHPSVRLREIGGALRGARDRVGLLIDRRLERERSLLTGLRARLEALSPLGVLDRGYAIALDAKGRAVRDASGVAAGDRLDLRLAKGRLRTTVDETCD